MSESIPETAPRRRPLPVTELAGLVLIFAALNLIRLYQTVQNWRFLTAWLPFSPLYPALTGLVWGVAGLVLVWGLWRCKPWSSLWTLIYFLGYTLYYWADRFIMPGNPERNLNAPFAALVNLFILVWIAWVLRSRKARAYFGVNDEPRPENTGIA